MSLISTSLFLRNFEVTANIGIHAHEKTGPQRVLINIDMEVDIDADTVADDIQSVVDYDFLREGIQKLVDKKRYNLQESLCLDILEIVRTNPHIRAATVSTRKPDVYPDSEAVGCVIRFER